MKKFLCILTMFFLIGCAAGAPSQVYRPPNYTGPAWEITGTYNKLIGQVVIKINGELAIDQRLPLLANAGELRGKYKDHNVVANLSEVKTGFFSQPYTQCIIFIDNDRAATLSF